MLYAAIKRQYDDRLVERYGRVQGSDPARQLANAEGWLKDHPQNAVLLLALGRLSLRNALWGKARDYLEASLRFDHRPETCAELARLARAAGRYRKQQPVVPAGRRSARSQSSGYAVTVSSGPPCGGLDGFLQACERL